MSHAYVKDPDFTLYVGDVREVLAELSDESVNCVVTSPPYWGLRDYSCDGQLGLEPTPELYVENMVQVFREVRRVLRKDGTLWLNIGDSYAMSKAKGQEQEKNPSVSNGQGGSLRWNPESSQLRAPGLKPKDLVGIPWRLAFALQADGWYLRSEIIWSKPNPMPESVTNRPTKSHEQVFLFTKEPRYFFDQEAVREPHMESSLRRYEYGGAGANGKPYAMQQSPNGNEGGRNVRSVWEIATQPFAEAHFATYPEELVRRCVLAGCPEWVCGTCGKPRERITGGGGGEAYDKPVRMDGRPDGAERRKIGGGQKEFDSYVRPTTVGWSDCGHNNYTPGVVLDPFLGSGTSALVARNLNRHCVGIELNPDYAELAARRLGQLSLLAVGGDPE